MAIPLAAAGVAIGVYGIIKSNSDKADAEEQNARYFKEQADYAQAAGDRELAVFKTKAAQLRDLSIGAYAKGGVALTGSPLSFLESQSIAKEQEATAIRDETARRVRLAMLHGDQSTQAADNYSSFGTNFVQAAPTVLQGASVIYKNYSESKPPTAKTGYNFYNGDTQQWETR